MYQRKTKDVYVVQGYYGIYWEDLTEEETRKEGREQLKCYNENEQGIAHRLYKKRVAI